MLHKNIPIADRHAPHNYEYADATARVAATGFVVGDVGKLAFQASDATYWVLASTTPTWNPLKGEVGAPGSVASVNGLTGTVVLNSDNVTEGTTNLYYTTARAAAKQDAGAVVDTNPIVKGSVDATKQMRFEVDGLTTGTTRVITVPNADITIAAAGANSDITSISTITGIGNTATTHLQISSGGAVSIPGNLAVTNYNETVYAPAAGSAWTVDLANGTVQKFTTNANATVTLPASAAGKSYIVLIAYGGVHTITWAGGSTIKWSGGTAPTATAVNGKFDIFAFTCDGTNTYGRSGGSNF